MRHAIRMAIVNTLVLLLALVGCGGRSASPREAMPSPGAGGSAEPLALDLAWSWGTPGGLSPGLPAADGDGVAVTWSHQLLVGFDNAGMPRWEARHLGLLEVAPALTPGLVVAASDDGLLAYDRATGQLRWEARLGEEPTSPVVVDDRVVVTTWEGSMVALRVTDGGPAWRVPLGGPSRGPAAVADGAVLATFDTGRAAGVTAVEAVTGRSRWSVPLPADGVSAPAVAGDGTVVVVAGDVAAHGLSVDDGAERWRTPLDGSGSPEVVPLAVAGAGVVVGHRRGGMAMLDTLSGAPRWQSKAHGAAVRGSPVGPGPDGWFAMPLDDGRLLLAGPDRPDVLRNAPGFVRGVAAGEGGTLLVGVGRGDDNHLSALRGW